MDYFSFVKSIDLFGQGVVVAVANAAERKFDASFFQPPVESAQDCSHDYQKKLQTCGLRPSISGKGNCAACPELVSGTMRPSRRC
jgi:hypothetical protein